LALSTANVEAGRRRRNDVCKMSAKEKAEIVRIERILYRLSF
jgi:hypothetical protein